MSTATATYPPPSCEEEKTAYIINTPFKFNQNSAVHLTAKFEHSRWVETVVGQFIIKWFTTLFVDKPLAFPEPGK